MIYVLTQFRHALLSPYRLVSLFCSAQISLILYSYVWVDPYVKYSMPFAHAVVHASLCLARIHFIIDTISVCHISRLSESIGRTHSHT
jgi:hypothetical protein